MKKFIVLLFAGVIFLAACTLEREPAHEPPPFDLRAALSQVDLSPVSPLGWTLDVDGMLYVMVGMGARGVEVTDDELDEVFFETQLWQDLNPLESYKNEAVYDHPKDGNVDGAFIRTFYDDDDNMHVFWIIESAPDIMYHIIVERFGMHTQWAYSYGYKNISDEDFHIPFFIRTAAPEPEQHGINWDEYYEIFLERATAAAAEHEPFIPDINNIEYREALSADETAEIKRLIEIVSSPSVGSPFNFGYFDETAGFFSHPEELDPLFFIYRYACYVVNEIHSFGINALLNIDDLTAHIKEYYWAGFEPELLDYEEQRGWDEETRTFRIVGGERGGNLGFHFSGVFNIVETYRVDNRYYVLTTFGESMWKWYAFADVMHVFERNENGNLHLVQKLPYGGELPPWLTAVQEFIAELSERLSDESPPYIEALGFTIEIDYEQDWFKSNLYHELFALFREHY
jgi:hypothetical protein